eukprot:4508359-Amphidinium_carterae.2
MVPCVMRTLQSCTHYRLLRCVIFNMPRAARGTCSGLCYFQSSSRTRAPSSKACWGHWVLGCGTKI